MATPARSIAARPVRQIRPGRSMDRWPSQVVHRERERHSRLTGIGDSDDGRRRVGGMDRSGGSAAVGAKSGHSNARSVLVTLFNKAASWTLGSVIAVLLSALVYDWFMPVYHDIALTDVRIDGTTIYGSLMLTKDRDCKVVNGTLAAFAHVQDVREPVLYVDAKGYPLVLRDLPASKIPYMLKVGWQLDHARPLPDAVSVSFRGTCGFFTKRLRIGPLPTGLQPGGNR